MIFRAKFWDILPRFFCQDVNVSFQDDNDLLTPGPLGTTVLMVSTSERASWHSRTGDGLKNLEKNFKKIAKISPMDWA